MPPQRGTGQARGAAAAATATAAAAAPTTATTTSKSTTPSGKTLYFYGHTDKTSRWPYLSNFFPAPFEAPDPGPKLRRAGQKHDKGQGLQPADVDVEQEAEKQVEREEEGEEEGQHSQQRMLSFATSEQYMMYCKAQLFGDEHIADAILHEGSQPRRCKALGRCVSNFSDRVWVQHREQIMYDALWWKFGGGAAGLVASSSSPPSSSSSLPEIGRLLLATGQHELVEAARNDAVWGIGFDAASAPGNRAHWGLNLLGKALMAVRIRLREQCGE